MSYKLVDIDEMDIEYTFTSQELQGVEVLDMINLNKRGVHPSTYHLPLTGVETGQMLTIRNRDFCLQDSGRYSGVQFLIHPGTHGERKDYWFLFENQTADFFFDGTGWLLLSGEPVPVTDPNFMGEQDMKYGYVHIKEFLDPEKKVLFRNFDLSSFDPNNLSGRFFRDGEIGTTQEDDFKAHKHPEVGGKHAHNIPDSNIIYPLDNIFSNIIGKKKLYPQKIRKWAERIMKVTETQPMKLLKTVSQLRDEIMKWPKEVQDKLREYRDNFLEKIHYDEFQENFQAIKARGFDLESELIKLIMETIEKNWDTILAFLINFIQNDWDEFVELMKTYLPDSEITKLIESLGTAAPSFVLSYVKSHSDEIKQMILDTLQSSPEFLKVIHDISEFLKAHIVLVDSTLTECEKTNKNNVPVFRLLSNTYIAGLTKKDFLSFAGSISDMFPIVSTDECSVQVLENVNGIDETRPENVAGQYIMKCY